MGQRFRKFSYAVHLSTKDRRSLEDGVVSLLLYYFNCLDSTVILLPTLSRKLWTLISTDRPRAVRVSDTGRAGLLP